jgi:uncharacterized membrane protein
MLNRDEAQRRADAIRTFQRELERLEAGKVIALTDAQRESLRTHHRDRLTEYAAFDIDRDIHAKQLSLGMRIASFLGALALAASVFLLFYQYWGRLSIPVQVVILVAGAVGTFAATIWIRHRDSTGYFTNLAAMVTLACFVLNIVALGQIFNIAASDGALLAWGALALLLAYTCDLRLLLAAGIAFTSVYLASRIATIGGVHWPGVPERPESFFLAGIALFTLPLLIRHERFAGFPPIYRALGLIALLLPMFALSLVGSLSYIDANPTTVERVYQVLSFVVCAELIWLGARRQWRETVNIGVLFFVIHLYAKYVDWWWDDLPKYLFFLLVGLTAIAILLVLRHARTSWLRLAGGEPA